MDLLLMGTLPARTLAHVMKLRLSRHQSQDLWRDEVVVQDRVRLTKQPQRFECEQFRIARPRSNEINFAFHKTSFPASD